MLESQTVEALFRRLSTRYGSAWMTKWAGLPAADVMTDWANVLSGVSNDSIRYALEYLPEFVPTAHQFREMCRRSPLSQYVPLPVPKPTDEEKARVRAMLKTLRDKIVMRHA